MVKKEKRVTEERKQTYIVWPYGGSFREARYVAALNHQDAVLQVANPIQGQDENYFVLRECDDVSKAHDMIVSLSITCTDCTHEGTADLIQRFEKTRE